MTGLVMTDSQIEAAGYSSRGQFIEMEISKARESQESLAEKWQTMVMTGKVADDAKARDAFIQKILVRIITTALTLKKHFLRLEKLPLPHHLKVSLVVAF